MEVYTSQDQLGEVLSSSCHCVNRKQVFQVQISWENSQVSFESTSMKKHKYFWKLYRHGVKFSPKQFAISVLIQFVRTYN